ncbi:MAG: DUF1697 domain-containing protein [Bacteroidales bacterium]
MATFIALLRAVNVGGTGALPMADLRRLCAEAGFLAPQTCLTSGNVVFESPDDAVAVKAALEQRLRQHMGKAVDVLVRSAAEMEAVLAGNPFPGAAPNRTVAIFLDHPPAADALDAATGGRGEELRLGQREIYVHYGDGMARSKLHVPAAERGTARNMNTVAKLVALAGGKAG